MATYHTPAGSLHVDEMAGCSVRIGTARSNRRQPLALRAVLEAGFELMAPLRIEPTRAAAFPVIARNAATTEAARVQLTVQPADDRDAVVLLAQDGVYTWHFPNGSGGPSRLDSGVGRPAQSFALELLRPGSETSRPAPLAGPVVPSRQFNTRDVTASADAWVISVPRVPIAGLAIGALEAAVVRTGLRRMTASAPTVWRPVRCFRPPRRRPARVLLFLHGTFSTTVTSFGTLGVSRHGRRFLGRAVDAYDLVVGYDHRTLSLDPSVNAADALARLQRLRFRQPPVIDVVGFSRGGLVARAFVEEAIPASDWAGSVRRLVLIGAPNDGSPMADPQYWKDLIDRHTTLIVARAEQLPGPVSRAVVSDLVRGIGVLAKLLASQTPDVQDVPGLAAMVPGSEFLTHLNGTGPGQPTPGRPPMYAVGADFEPSLRLDSPLSLPTYPVLWMLDQGADHTLGGPNDLIVATSSTRAVDVPVGTPSPLVLDYLEVPAADGVFHFAYFDHETVVQRIDSWLTG